MTMIRLLIATMLLSLVACSGDPVKPNIYLLRSDHSLNVSRDLDTSPISLATVNIATYIDQAGLVLQTEDGQITIAQQHLWAEPLRHSLMLFLAEEISVSAGKDVLTGRRADVNPAIRLDISIDQLHGTHDGNAVLAAYWTVISKKGKETKKLSYRFSKSAALAKDGYDELVYREKELLRGFAEAIAQTLGEF